MDSPEDEQKEVKIDSKGPRLLILLAALLGFVGVILIIAKVFLRL